MNAIVFSRPLFALTPKNSCDDCMGHLCANAIALGYTCCSDGWHDIPPTICGDTCDLDCVVDPGRGKGCCVDKPTPKPSPSPTVAPSKLPTKSPTRRPTPSPTKECCRIEVVIRESMNQPDALCKCRSAVVREAPVYSTCSEAFATPRMGCICPFSLDFSGSGLIDVWHLCTSGECTGTLGKTGDLCNCIDMTVPLALGGGSGWKTLYSQTCCGVNDDCKEITEDIPEVTAIYECCGGCVPPAYNCLNDVIDKTRQFCTLFQTDTIDVFPPYITTTSIFNGECPMLDSAETCEPKCQHPPTPQPTKPPTKAPLSPSKSPTKAPTRSPTKAPTKSPTKAPTKSPTKAPIKSPTKAPTKSPTKAPTKSPTKAPSRSPTKAPTKSPTKAPTSSPTSSPIGPSPSPTKAPTKSPTKAPTKSPTKAPSPSPSKAPSKSPTKAPTKSPTKAPSSSPTKAPTKSPTKAPTKSPTKAPTKSPTKAPTQSPTKAPTKSPTTSPSLYPTVPPTSFPSKAPAPGTAAPTPPTNSPTKSPTKAPTKSPTKAPSKSPTRAPSKSPTKAPTQSPSKSPTKSPTHAPTKSPSKSPTKSPTKAPTKSPTKAPTNSPTPPPTSFPSSSPTYYPTKSPIIGTASPTPPTLQPTNAPSKSPTKAPTKSPTKAPTKAPTKSPTKSPTPSPTLSPTKYPSQSPTTSPVIGTASPTPPTSSPSSSPSSHPTSSPSLPPSSHPTMSPVIVTMVSPSIEPTTSGNNGPTTDGNGVSPTPRPSEREAIATNRDADSQSSPIGMIVGILAVLLIICLLCILLVAARRRRQGKTLRRALGDDGDDNDNERRSRHSTNLRSRSSRRASRSEAMPAPLPSLSAGPNSAPTNKRSSQSLNANARKSRRQSVHYAQIQSTAAAAGVPHYSHDTLASDGGGELRRPPTNYQDLAQHQQQLNVLSDGSHYTDVAGGRRVGQGRRSSRGVRASRNYGLQLPPPPPPIAFDTDDELGLPRDYGSLALVSRAIQEDEDAGYISVDNVMASNAHANRDYTNRPSVAPGPSAAAMEALYGNLHLKRGGQQQQQFHGSSDMDYASSGTQGSLPFTFDTASAPLPPPIAAAQPPGPPNYDRVSDRDLRYINVGDNTTPSSSINGTMGGSSGGGKVSTQYQSIPIPPPGMEGGTATFSPKRGALTSKASRAELWGGGR